jgi:hypothetical protein
MTSQQYQQSLNFQPMLLSHDFKLGTPFQCHPASDAKVSFICRIRKSGKLTIVPEKFGISPDLAWDYIYATICVKEQVLKIYHKGKVLKVFPDKRKL